MSKQLMTQNLLRRLLRLGLHLRPLRILLYLAAFHGLRRASKHFITIVQALTRCSKNYPLWAPPLFIWHLVIACVRVCWRHSFGTPLSKHWTFGVELLVECVRPHRHFVQHWNDTIHPTINALTDLDYFGEFAARFCHPQVCMEFVTQGVPRPLTWVWFEDSAELSPETPKLVILFLHGGGFWAFTGKSHLEYVARLVKTMGASRKMLVKAVVVDTRRAPEHQWPAPLHDAVACFEWLQQGAGYKASEIVVAGDSAGGGLCLSLLTALRDEGKVLPLAATVVSPLTDFSRAMEHFPTGKDVQKDYLPSMAVLVSCQHYVKSDEDPKHPLISPKYGQLHSLPPVLIQAGTTETLARDSIEFAQRLEAYGGQVQLEMYPDMPHVFPLMAPLGLRDAVVAIERQSRFIENVVLKGFGKDEPRLNVLVMDRRTQSFSNLQEANGSVLTTAASSPALSNLARSVSLASAVRQR